MDHFSLFDAFSFWAQCDPRATRKTADAVWSPLGFLILFLLAAFTVIYCVTSTQP